MKLSAAGSPTPRLDARLLMGVSLGRCAESIIAGQDENICADAQGAFERLVERRLASEPVAYIRGVKEFWSLELAVDRRVLIPRPDTEILVMALIERLGERKSPRIADVGTGSGAVALALATEMPGARILGMDISADSLEVARVNVSRHGLSERISLFRADLLGPLGTGALDAVAANLPYVATSKIETLHPGVRDHEPLIALDGGDDGLVLVRRLVRDAPRCLAAGGLIALEVADDQTDEVRRVLSDGTDFDDVQTHRDLGRLKRVVTAFRCG